MSDFQWKELFLTSFIDITSSGVLSTILQYDEKIPCQCPSKEGEKQHTHNGQPVSQQGQNTKLLSFLIYGLLIHIFLCCVSLFKIYIINLLIRCFFFNTLS